MFEVPPMLVATWEVRDGHLCLQGSESLHLPVIRLMPHAHSFLIEAKFE